MKSCEPRSKLLAFNDLEELNSQLHLMALLNFQAWAEEDISKWKSEVVSVRWKGSEIATMRAKGWQNKIVKKQWSKCVDRNGNDMQ